MFYVYMQFPSEFQVHERRELASQLWYCLHYAFGVYSGNDYDRDSD